MKLVHTTFISLYCVSSFIFVVNSRFLLINIKSLKDEATDAEYAETRSDDVDEILSDTNENSSTEKELKRPAGTSHSCKIVDNKEPRCKRDGPCLVDGWLDPCELQKDINMVCMSPCVGCSDSGYVGKCKEGETNCRCQLKGPYGRTHIHQSSDTHETRILKIGDTCKILNGVDQCWNNFKQKKSKKEVTCVKQINFDMYGPCKEKQDGCFCDECEKTLHGKVEVCK